MDDSGLQPGRDHPAPMNEREARRSEHRTRALDFARQLPADAALSHESAAIVAGIPTYDVPAAVKVSVYDCVGARMPELKSPVPA